MASLRAKATAGDGDGDGDGDGASVFQVVPATQHRMPSQQSKRQHGVGRTWASAVPSTSSSAIARAATILQHIMACGIVRWLPPCGSWLQFCETAPVNRPAAFLVLDVWCLPSLGTPICRLRLRGVEPLRMCTAVTECGEGNAESNE